MTGHPGLGIDFDLQLHDGLVAGRGTSMLHEIGIRCPTCQIDDSIAGMLPEPLRNNMPFCKECGGTGRLYCDPQMVRGLFSSARFQRNLGDSYSDNPADATFSPSPLHGSRRRDIGMNDKLTSTWPQPLDDGQVIVRGAATLGENRDNEIGVNPDEDRLWYEPARVIWCQGKDRKQYFPQANFIAGPGKVLRWVGERPALGSTYTVKYAAFTEWVVLKPPDDRRDRDGRDLGPLVQLQRRHVALVNESPVVIDSDRISVQSRVTRGW